MRQVREILRLKYEQRLGHRAIARAYGVGVGTVGAYCHRAQQAGVTWPVPAAWDDAQLEARLLRATARALARALSAYEVSPSGGNATGGSAERSSTR